MLRMSYQGELFNNYMLKHNLNGQQQNFKESRGLKLYYILHLGCVKELRDQLCEPSAQQDLTLKCNLVNLMAFYSKAEYVTDEQQQLYKISQIKQIKIQNNILAQEFLKITCQLWSI